MSLKALKSLVNRQAYQKRFCHAVYFPAHAYASFILRKAHPMEKMGTELPVSVSWNLPGGKWIVDPILV
jgi:hypothetical protein